MAKSIIERSPVLPDIDKQIDFVKRVRKDVIPSIRDLQNDLDIIFAIEQSLIAAKVYARFENTSFGKGSHSAVVTKDDTNYNQILNSFKIKATSIRVDILKEIIAKQGREFSLSEIFEKTLNNRLLSKTAVIATLNLFKSHGLITEVNGEKGHKSKRVGRPETKFKLSNDSPSD
jgi:hypothetical protein